MEFTILLAFPEEFQAAAVPACVSACLTRYTVSLVLGLAFVCFVLSAACSACVFLGLEFSCVVSPLAALHALLGLMFQLLGEGAGVAYIYAVL